MPDGDDRRPGAVVAHTPGTLVAEDERLDPGIELAGIEGPDHDVVDARLEEADPLVDVVAPAEGEDRHVRERRRVADDAAGLDDVVVVAPEIDDDDLVLAVGRDGGLRVPHARHDVGRRLEGRGDGVVARVGDEQDATGHVVPRFGWDIEGPAVAGGSRGYNADRVGDSPAAFWLRGGE